MGARLETGNLPAGEAVFSHILMWEYYLKLSRIYNEKPIFIFMFYHSIIPAMKTDS